MNKKSLIFCLFCISVSGIYTSGAQEKQNNPLYLDYFNIGREYFAKADYQNAIVEFRKAIEICPSSLKSHGFLMLGNCHMALGNYKEADNNYDSIITGYGFSEEFPEALYQKGRIAFINGKYEISIDFLNQFIDNSASHPLEGNAFYWMAESLFNLGHIEESLKLYRIVETEYKDSYKYEAAKYRIELINLGKREEELIKLLKWSHEEALREREQFIKKEKEYNQAILSYQKKLALLSEEDTNSLLISLRETNNVLKKQLEMQDQLIKKMNDEINALKNSQQEGKSRAAAPGETQQDAAAGTMPQ